MYQICVLLYNYIHNYLKTYQPKGEGEGETYEKNFKSTNYCNVDIEFVCM